jgi:putative ABC transport system substrate-binding protein
MKHRAAAVLLFSVVLMTTLAWSTDSWGQEKIPRVGILTFFAISDDPTRDLWLTPFRRMLAEQGWIEGKNVSFEYRSAGSDPSRFAQAAADLVRLNVDIIFAQSAPAVRASQTATRTIPIVAIDFTTDPVAAGYIQNYGRPGGNITGVFLNAPEFSGKWLELLKSIVPGLSRAVVLWDPSPGAAHLQGVQSLGRSSRLQLQVVEVRKPDDINTAFAAFRGQPQALIILPSPMMYVESERLAKLAMKHRLPATSMARLFAKAGGVIAYGPEMASANERSAVLVAKILRGSKPADLPVEGPSKFELVVNLKTAKALGITIPESILLRADEVIR